MQVMLEGLVHLGKYGPSEILLGVHKPPQHVGTTSNAKVIVFKSFFFQYKNARSNLLHVHINRSWKKRLVKNIALEVWLYWKVNEINIRISLTRMLFSHWPVLPNSKHWVFPTEEILIFLLFARTRRQTHHPFETVVFSSLSSILHPKSRRSEEDENDEEVPELDCGKINSGKILPPISLDCDDTFESTESSSSPTTPVHNGQTNKSRLSSTSSNSHSVPTAAVTRSISMKKKKKGLFSKALSPRRNTSTS